MDKLKMEKQSGLIITTSLINLLRKTLFENLGQKKAGKFLLRFGKDLGLETGKALLETGKNRIEALQLAELLHIDTGHISQLTKYGVVQKPEEDMIFKNFSGMWHGSFEVESHLQDFGKVNECSCYIISGFISGVLTVVLEEDIFVKELTCRSKGDEHCTYNVNTRKYWESNGEVLDIYEDDKFIEELEMTYDKLLKKTMQLNEVNNFHSKITDTIAQKNDLSKLLETAYTILKIPIFIVNLNGEVIENIGHENISTIEWAKVIKSNKHTKVHLQKSYKLHMAPIYVDQETFAYCCFVYPKDNELTQNDLVYLERLAVASSVCFLYEKISFETTERFKINFLERMIYNHFKDNGEMYLHANYIEPKISPAFCTLAIDIKENSNVPIDAYQIILNLSRELKKYQLTGMLSKKDRYIVLFLYNLEPQQKYMDNVKSLLNNALQSFNCKVGISNKFIELHDFKVSLAEAEKAMNFPTKDKFIYYSELGIYSSLLENLKPETLRQVAKQELKSLLDPDEKSRTLLYTLYIYLKNNQKLEKTMMDLSLSIGGTKYRLQKIEAIIGKKLKDATTFAFLLIIIETLLLSKEISFD
ncbi:XylR N-terminal domain-containing protein [Planococcus shenhongbingii]|uniref:V4R domain-containing protein n=1 Tax=Planococcus shenhongbingii TaxID=3058398 RepID=UPI00262412C7|nr:V4R domain-containing protein [Planococcus sp. N016]WKA58261.1 XylR N-terminal domain-containing protein [Planococcus sp. N016]